MRSTDPNLAAQLFMLLHLIYITKVHAYMYIKLLIVWVEK